MADAVYGTGYVFFRTLVLLSVSVVRYVVSVGCIKPLCDLLTVQDPRMVVVTLEGLENILKVGNKDLVDGVNPFSVQIEEIYGTFS